MKAPNVIQNHSIPEAGKILGIGRTKTYEIIRNGELKSIKIGGRHLVPHQCLQDYLDYLLNHPG